MLKTGKKWLLILGIAAILGAVGLFGIGAVIRGTVISGLDDSYAGPGPYMVFDAKPGEKVRVNLFRNDSGEYVFFAPGFWDGAKKTYIKSNPTGDIEIDSMFSPVSQLQIDQRTVAGNGKIIDLDEGPHSISNGDRTGSLLVLKESPIHTLMLEYDEEDYDIWDAVLADSETADTAEDGAEDTAEDGVEVSDYESNYKLWKNVRVRLFDAEGRVVNSGIAEEFRVRGNTSANWPKKPFQLTMKDSTDFAGMGAAKKWNLLSNWSDKTLIRNTIAYDMASRAGLSYSPESIMTDLYINGNYQGTYQLCEKVEIGTNRVNISNLETLTTAKEDTTPASISKTLENGLVIKGYDMNLATDDVSGGYLLELERPSRIKDSISSFVTAKGQPVTIKSPKYADISEAEYIGNVWQEFEAALFSEDGKNPDNGRHYSEYIDMDSFVKKYLIEEIVRNYDASSTSQYFYKDSDSQDSRLCAGPVWDYDMSLGNTIMGKYTNQKYISSVDPYGIFAALPMDDFTLWYHLACHEDFNEQVRNTYYSVFLPQLYELENGGIQNLAQKYEASGVADMMRWGRLEDVSYPSFGGEYEKNVDILKDFVQQREHYLTSLWVDKKQPKKIYLDGGEADMYVAYVEAFEGEKVPYPNGDPELMGSTFDCWLNGYTDEPYDFDEIYEGQDLYLKARFK